MIGYIDMLLDLQKASDLDAQKAFGRHIHWGYWPKPDSAEGSANDYAAAAEMMIQEIFRAGKIANGMNVLDVGCGIGGTIASLNDQLSHSRFVGLNIDERQINHARNNVSPKAGNSLEWVIGDACQLPFNKESFDLISAVGCIFHFPSREKFLAEAARVLRPGGVLVVSDFIPRTITRPLLWLLNLLALRDIQYAYGKTDISYTTEKYRKSAQRHGLSMESIQNITRHTIPTYPFLNKLLKKCPENFDRGRFIRATKALEHGAKSGLVEYTILVFKKVSPGGE